MFRYIPFLAALALLFGATALPGSVGAHAAFVSSTPAGDSTLQAAPAQVSIVFSQAITRSGSSITVTGPNGSVVSGAATVSGNNMSAPVTAAGGGVYTVNWTNVSQDDGHEESGSFSFTVAAAQQAPAQSAPQQSAPAQTAPAQATPARPATTTAPAQTAPAQSAPAQTAPRATTQTAPATSAGALPSTGTGFAGDQDTMTLLSVGMLALVVLGGAAPAVLARVRVRNRR